MAELHLKEGGEVRQVRMGGDRAGFILTGGEAREEAIALADRVEEHIRFKYT